MTKISKLKNRKRVEIILDILKEQFKIYDSKISITDDGLVSLTDSCSLKFTDTHYLPIEFSNIEGCFDCSNSELTSLIGAPKMVGRDFDCSINLLTSLEMSPHYVGAGFDCSRNELTSLRGGPKIVNSYYDCTKNELTSLDGAPISINGYFYITVYANTPLLKLLTIKGIKDFYFYDPSGEQMQSLKKIFKEYYNINPINPTATIIKTAISLMQNGYGSNARL